MNWYKKATLNSQYLGTCVSTVDDGLWDATEMAQMIEKGGSCTLDKVIDCVPERLLKDINKRPDDFECEKYGNIVWIYDDKTDMHYFFRVEQ